VTIALVLGAGGVTGGAFHAGVLAALQAARGWDARTADVVVGTSAGSASAAALRAGLAPADLAARSQGAPLSPEAMAILRAAGMTAAPPAMPAGARVRIGRPAAPGIIAGALRRPWRIRPTAVMAGLLPEGTVPTAMITDGMNALHRGGEWPATPTWMCAVRLRDGGLVVFGRDGAPSTSVGEAVAASCAIPGWFAPVEIGGERYVDGGAHSLTNVGEVAALQPDLVLVSSPMSRFGPGRAQLAFEVQGLRRRHIPVITFAPTEADQKAMGLDAMDPSRRAEVTRRVRESALLRIDALGSRLDALN
jgi:NTE family protein